MGVDPGTARIGWAIVEKEKNPQLISYGCITTPKDKPAAQRLLLVYQAMQQLFTKHKPGCVAVEDLFFAKNAKTAITVAQARGVILLAAAKAHIPVTAYSPPAIKRAVSGYGNADKKQVQKMVQATLKLPTIPQPDDAADAIAVALTHCFTKRFQEKK